MKLKKICRIESYPNRTLYENGDIVECDWNEVYILDLRYGKKRWFNEKCELIENPLKNEYNLKEFYKEVENAWKDKKYLSGVYVENNKEEEFDIIFKEEDIFPYNVYNGINYYDLSIEE